MVVPYLPAFAAQSGTVRVAYSFGTPVLASDTGALGTTIRQDQSGWLARPGDVGDLAAKIAPWSATTTDGTSAATAKRLGQERSAPARPAPRQDLPRARRAGMSTAGGAGTTPSSVAGGGDPTALAGSRDGHDLLWAAAPTALLDLPAEPPTGYSQTRSTVQTLLAGLSGRRGSEAAVVGEVLFAFEGPTPGDARPVIVRRRAPPAAEGVARPSLGGLVTGVRKAPALDAVRDELGHEVPSLRGHAGRGAPPPLRPPRRPPPPRRRGLAALHRAPC